MQIVTAVEQAGYPSTRQNRLEIKNGYKRQKRNCILIKGSVQQEDTAINICGPDDRPSKHTKQKLTRTGNTDGSVINSWRLL